MVLYRRNRVTGGTYFFTVTLRDRKSSVLIDRIDLLRVAFHIVKRERPYRIDAMVILPDTSTPSGPLPPETTTIPVGGVRSRLCSRGRWWRTVIAWSTTRRAGTISGSVAWEHTIRDDENLRR